MMNKGKCGSSSGSMTKINGNMASPSKGASSTPKVPSGMKGRVVQVPKAKGSPVKR